MIVEISTDGSCSPNPGPGGWAAIFRAGGHAKAIFGWEPHSTNIRMEMTAVIKALEHLKKGCEIKLYTDSEFTMKGATLWIKRWKINGFQTQPFGKNLAHDVANKDLWLQLDVAMQRHTIEWQWVKGHASHDDNNHCDRLAMRARKDRVHGEIILAAPIIDMSVEEPIRSIRFRDLEELQDETHD